MTLTVVSYGDGHSAGAVASLATVVGWTPIKGNLLVLRAGSSQGSTTASSLSVTTNGTGWVKCGGAFAGNVTTGGGGALWIKSSTGDEDTLPPTIAATVNQTVAWTVEEWPSLANVASGLHGIDMSIFPVGPTVPATYITSTSSGITLSSNARTMVYPEEAHFTVYGGRGATNQPPPTWGGGAAASGSGNLSGVAGFCFGGMSLSTAGIGTGVTHTANFTNSQGGRVTVIGTVSLRAVIRPKLVGWGMPLNAP